MNEFVQTEHRIMRAYKVKKIKHMRFIIRDKNVNYLLEIIT